MEFALVKIRVVFLKSDIPFFPFANIFFSDFQDISEGGGTFLLPTQEGDFLNNKP